MKSIKKIFAGLLMATAAFGFFGCADSEGDDELTVAFEESGTTEKTVKMTASSSKMGDNEVYIVYTTNGDEPTVKFEAGKGKADLATVTDEKGLLALIDYGTADFVKSGESITLKDSAVVKAKAFYVVKTDNDPLKTGPLSTKEITITPDTTGVTDSDENKSGNLSFKLTKTGNSFSTHYYDTSANTFKYGETEHCYFQFQFSTKANGSGNWYLYIRQLGASAPIVSEAGTKFVAKGTFEGSCFNKTEVTEERELKLKYVNAKTKEETDFATVNVSAGNDSSFTFNVTAGEDGKTNITAAIDANDAK